MQKIKEIINTNLKDAMREKDQETLSVLRMLLAAIKDKEISLRKGQEVKLSDEQVLDVVASEVKKRKDSVIAYEQGEREDLAKKEKVEIEILKKYLPEQMSDEELEKIVRDVIETQNFASVPGMKEFGQIMGQIMPKVKGKADGNKVSEAVKEVLSK